jgi:hypothetical protein
MQFSVSILSMLAAVGVVCAQPFPVRRKPYISSQYSPRPLYIFFAVLQVISVDYSSGVGVRLFNAGDCISVHDPITGIPATSATADQTVVCPIFTYVLFQTCLYAYPYFIAPVRDALCTAPLFSLPLVLPEGVKVPNPFDGFGSVANSVVCSQSAV